MGWIGWTVVVLAAWTAVACFVALVLGSVIRRRDRQVPADDTTRPVPVPRAPTAVPDPGSDAGEPPAC